MNSNRLQIFSTLFQPVRDAFHIASTRPAPHRLFYNSKMYITIVFTQRAVLPKNVLSKSRTSATIKICTYIRHIRPMS